MPQTIHSPFWHPAHAKAFILDWDGVLADTRLDFKPLRQKYFGGGIVPLIEAAEALPAPQCGDVKAEIRRIEMEGADRAQPVDGAHDLIAWLTAMGRPWAVVSRNCRDSILLAAERCGITLPPVLLSREDPHVKPAPEALALAAQKLEVDLAGCVMVGDFIYDILGARRAAVRAVLVQRDGREWGHMADVVYATVRDFVVALSNPGPLVPWEYRDLVERKGAAWLESVARHTYLLPSDDGALRQAFLLAGLGAIRIAVPEAAKLGMKDWQESLLPSRTLDMPLHVLLRDVMSTRWPCVRVISVARDAPCEGSIAVPLLPDVELERFLGESSR